MPMNGFAIRISNTDHKTKITALYKVFKEAAKNLPAFKVEGINHPSRGPMDIKKTPFLYLPTPKGVLEIGEAKMELRNLLTVGVSSKYDVSFEAESTIKLNEFVSLVPIYDLNRDFITIVTKLTEYILNKYGVVLVLNPPSEPKKKTPVEVVYHSNFIRVGSNRVEYGSIVAKMLEKPKNKKKLLFL